MLGGIAAFGLAFSFSGSSVAQTSGAAYSFQVEATIPGPTPGFPAFFTNLFEIGGLDDNGGGAWGAEFNSNASSPTSQSQGTGEWVPDRSGAGGYRPAAVTGGLDPEGVMFSTFHLGPVNTNNVGEGAFTFELAPALPPSVDTRLNAGAYRVDLATGVLKTIAKTGSPAPTGPNQIAGSSATFAGVSFNTSINDNGDVVFHGVTQTSNGTYVNPLNGLRYGAGIYRSSPNKSITAIVVPGDPAPSGGRFDNLRNAWLNDQGDIAFGGHTTSHPACSALSCAESVYFRPAATGIIQSIAIRNQVAPVPPLGRWVYDYAFGPRINNAGDFVFIGCIMVPRSANCGLNRGVFLYRGGTVIPIAYPGLAFQARQSPSSVVTDFVTVRASNFINNYYINDLGDVVFGLTYQADVNGDSILDSGVFTWSNGSYGVVAKTGDVIPGLGTIAHMSQPANVTSTNNPRGYTFINNRRQILFQAVLDDGRGALVLATPPK